MRTLLKCVLQKSIVQVICHLRFRNLRVVGVVSVAGVGLSVLHQAKAKILVDVIVVSSFRHLYNR